MSKTLSNIKLIQHGANMMLNLKQKDKTTAAVITKSIIKDILRKYLNSFSDNGFSGVSNGHNTAIETAEIIVKHSKTILKSNIFDNRITTKQAKIESVDIISHLVSVFA